MNKPLRIAICHGVLTALFTLGCGGDVDTVPVSGRVTLDGDPLADAHISFEPVHATAEDNSVGSYAVTDAQGRYTLRLVTTGEPGAMPGLHTVRITTARPEDPSREDSPISPELVPPPYREGVEFEVPANGDDAADFALQSKH